MLDSERETADFRVIEQKWHDFKCWYISLPHGRVGLEYYKRRWYIVGLCVTDEYRGQGVAKALLDKCEELSGHSKLNLWLEPKAPNWLVNYYLKRGYNILQEGI